jgi:hypothetical protein
MKSPTELREELALLVNHWIFTDVQSTAQNNETIEDWIKKIQSEAWEDGYFTAKKYPAP